MKKENNSLSNIAYNYILERINSFVYKPNDPIIENDISEALHISRTPLREAMRQLEAEGFLIKVRNKGTFVRGYTQEDIRENFEIRSIFELYALQKCIEIVSPSEIKNVKEKLLALTPDSPKEAYYESDTALHNMITTCCMNTKIQAYLNSLNAQIVLAQKISAQTPNRLLRSKEEHLSIIEAIEEGNLDVASKRLKEHLDNVEQSYVQAFNRMRMNML